jgi:hypothetical protein
MSTKPLILSNGLIIPDVVDFNTSAITLAKATTASVSLSTPLANIDNSAAGLAGVDIISKSGTALASYVRFRSALGTGGYYLIHGDAYTAGGTIPADSFAVLNAGAVPVAWITQAGAVTVGPASSGGAHTTQAAATGVGTVLIVNNTTDATNAASIRFRDAGSTMGSVGASTSYPLRVTSSTDTEVFLVPAGLGNGTLTLTSNVVGVSSDARLKTLTENQEIPGLAEICSITPARYRWNNPDLGDDVHLGFIAQDVQPHIPEAVGKPGGDGMLGFYDRPVLAAAVKAIQELSAKLELQARSLDAANARITELENK